MTETKPLHLEEQVAVEILKKQVECNHDFRFKGEIGKYHSYTCKECNKVYWVEPIKYPTKT